MVVLVVGAKRWRKQGSTGLCVSAFGHSSCSWELTAHDCDGRRTFSPPPTEWKWPPPCLSLSGLPETVSGRLESTFLQFDSMSFCRLIRPANPKAVFTFACVLPGRSGRRGDTGGQIRFELGVLQRILRVPRRPDDSPTVEEARRLSDRRDRHMDRQSPAARWTNKNTNVRAQVQWSKWKHLAMVSGQWPVAEACWRCSVCVLAPISSP